MNNWQFSGRSSQLKMPWQKQWLYLTSLINCLVRLLWSSHHCCEKLTITRSLCPEKKGFFRVKTIYQLQRKYRSINWNSLNCCLVKYTVCILRTITHHIKGNADPRKISLLHLLLQGQNISQLLQQGGLEFTVHIRLSLIQNVSSLLNQ